MANIATENSNSNQLKTFTTCISLEDYCNRDLVANPFFTEGQIVKPNPNGSNDIPYGKVGTLWQDVKYIEEGGCNSTFYCVGSDQVNQTLEYNVYYPSKTLYNYIDCPMQCVIFIHGGGYSDCSNFRLGKIETLLVQLAMRGFVVFNVEYRRGRLLDVTTTPSGYYTSVQQQLEGYRAGQDARGAIRSIIKRQLNETTGDMYGDDYRIDLNKIFLAGNSGGALTVMAADFFQTNAQIAAIFPKEPTSTYTMADALGNPLVDYYYAEPTNSLYDYYNRIKGILNCWGGVYLPTWVATFADIDNFFSGNVNNLPGLISFGGQNDAVFPPEKSNVYFSGLPATGPTGYNKSNTLILPPPYNTMFTYSDCVLNDFQLNKNATTRDLVFYGPQALFDYWIYKSGRTECYVDCQMEHGLDDDGCTGTNCFKSNFGTSLTTEVGVYTYIAQRAATFFQLLLNPSAGSLITTKFIECENKRVTCNVADHVGDVCCSECKNLGTSTSECNIKR